MPSEPLLVNLPPWEIKRIVFSPNCSIICFPSPVFSPNIFVSHWPNSVVVSFWLFSILVIVFFSILCYFMIFFRIINDLSLPSVACLYCLIRLPILYWFLGRFVTFFIFLGRCSSLMISWVINLIDINKTATLFKILFTITNTLLRKYFLTNYIISYQLIQKCLSIVLLIITICY